MKEEIRVYIVNKIDDFNLGIVYPTKKEMYVSLNDSSFIFLREGQNRKKLTKKLLSELIRFSSYRLLSKLDGDILNSYEVT